METRYAEFRVGSDGRSLTGTALRYGDEALVGNVRERFTPGAFGELPALGLNLQHSDVMLAQADSVTLTDTEDALEVRAVLPEGSPGISLVKRGALTGFSIEFVPNAERRNGGERIVDRASLTGIALVDRPAYPASQAEVRQDEGGYNRPHWTL